MIKKLSPIAVAIFIFFCFTPKIHAAISLVEVEPYSGSGGGSSTVIFNTPTTAGELIVVEAYTNPNGTVIGTPTDNKGDVYTEVYDQPNIGTHFDYSMWYAANVFAGVTEVSSTPGMGNLVDGLSLIAAHYTGIATTNPLDISTSTAIEQGDPWASAVVTTNQASELMIGQDFYAADPITPTGNWVREATSTESNEGLRMLYSDQIVSSTQANISNTGTGGTDNFPAIATFKAALDITPPQVSITAPISGVTVSSTIMLSASSTDNVAVQGVQFQIDGINLGSEITATSGPTTYSTTWNTASSSDGTHIISAIAYDTSNNSSTATSSVIVNNTSQSNSTPAPTQIVSVGVPASYGIPSYGLIQTSTSTILSGNTSSTSLSISNPSIEATIALLESELQSLLAGIPAQKFDFTRNLSLWSTGTDVQALQAFLVEQNKGIAAEKLANHGTTQVFGILTYLALGEYQASVGLPATGYFGPTTRAELNQLSNVMVFRE